MALALALASKTHGLGLGLGLEPAGLEPIPGKRAIKRVCVCVCVPDLVNMILLKING